MRALVLTHRWLGIACACLFAMWFASGIVMHFVPFPQLTETERFSGLAEIDPARMQFEGPEAAAAAAGAGVSRMRLHQRVDGPVYLLSLADGRHAAVHARGLGPASVATDELARAIAEDHGRRRGLAVGRSGLLALEDHDQWSVPNGLDPHRPLYRVALGDSAGTEVYVSSQTGEVVRDTTRFERGWNYAGSVVHWIYPTALRRNWLAWDRTVWGISLVALVVAVTGATLGLVRIRTVDGWPRSPYRGWHAWHHLLGLAAMIFVLTWILSGWLSMDHGRLFSTGRVPLPDQKAISGEPLWAATRGLAIRPLSSGSREIEWFTFGGTLYRRDRQGADDQVVIATGSAGPSGSERSALTPEEIAKAISRTGRSCAPPVVVGKHDAYPVGGSAQHPVYRADCSGDWIHIDAASGDVLELLDPSRRSYRWLYSALHTLDVPVLTARPQLRTAIILALCSLGLAFSLTGVVIGWRRLTR